MENESFNNIKKINALSSGIRIFKLKSLNLFKSNPIKDNKTRNVLYDDKFLAKNNENTSIISDPSINIFYKLEPSNNKNEVKSQDSSLENFLCRTNYYSLKNKQFSYESFSQGSPIKNLSNTKHSFQNYLPPPKYSIKSPKKQ